MSVFREAYRTDTELDPIGKQRKREARLQPVLTEQQHFQNVRNARPDTFSKTSARSFPRLKSEPSKPQRLCEDTPSVHTTEYPRHAGSNPVHTEMPPRTEAESAQSFLRGFRENFQSLQLLRRGRCQILLGVLLQRRLLDQSGGRRLLQHPRLAHLAEEMRPESLSQYRINDMLQKLFVGKIRQWLLRQQETTTETLRPDFSLLCDRGSVRLQKQSRRPELPELSTETEP